MGKKCKVCHERDLDESTIKQGIEVCLYCRRMSYLSEARRDVSAQAECPLSKLVVEVKTSKGAAVGQAKVTVVKGSARIKQDFTDEHGRYDTGKALEAGRYTVSATRKCYKPKQGQKTSCVLPGNYEEKVKLTLDPYEVKITPKEKSYTVVLDEDRNPKKPDHPILEFDITNGPPNHYFDVQLSRASADGLKGGPGLPSAWDKTKQQDVRVDKKLFSSWSNGDKALRLDGDGKATYAMPLKWWQDLVPTPFGQSGKVDFYCRVLAMDGPQSRPPCAASAIDKVEVKKKHKTVKIWLLTWNCGNKEPTNEQLRSLIVSKASAGNPDVIVIGVQEYPRKKKMPQKIVELLGGYRFIGEKVYNGRTGIFDKNCQAVGALAKTDVQAKVSVAANGNRYWGKGGVILGVKITKNETAFELAFISAHLDSYGKREDDIRMIISAFPERQFDAVFMMGDLNFRLDPKGKTFTRADICEMISGKSHELLNGHDELLSSSLVEEGSYQFEFPDPASFPPTYKIKSYTAGNHLRTYFGEEGVRDPGKELKPKKKRTGIDIGWLDRIGWAKRWRRILSGKGEVAQEEFVGLHEVEMSDHAAVLMKVLVTKKE